MVGRWYGGGWGWLGGGWGWLGGVWGVVERWCVCLYLFIFIIYTQLELLLFPMFVHDDVCGEGDVFGNWGKQV